MDPLIRRPYPTGRGAGRGVDGVDGSTVDKGPGPGRGPESGGGGSKASTGRRYLDKSKAAHGLMAPAILQQLSYLSFPTPPLQIINELSWEYLGEYWESGKKDF